MRRIIPRMIIDGEIQEEIIKESVLKRFIRWIKRFFNTEIL